jgi:hypothetical protein
MAFVRSVTMLMLAREALERSGNNADHAIAYLSERLRDDNELREALVKSAVEYERLEVLHS